MNYSIDIENVIKSNIRMAKELKEHYEKVATEANRLTSREKSLNRSYMNDDQLIGNGFTFNRFNL